MTARLTLGLFPSRTSCSIKTLECRLSSPHPDFELAFVFFALQSSEVRVLHASTHEFWERMRRTLTIPTRQFVETLVTSCDVRPTCTLLWALGSWERFQVPSDGAGLSPLLSCLLLAI